MVDPQGVNLARAICRTHGGVLSVVAAICLAIVAGACGSSAPGPPPPSVGLALVRGVPTAVASLPLTDDSGRATKLSAFHGKIVVLTDFLSLCQDVCPLTSVNFATMDRVLSAQHLASRVQFVELTVDPERDVPARLHAYRRIFGAPVNWSLLTGSPETIQKLWKFFGAAYEHVPEESPPGIDWWTHVPLTYDVDHEDVLVFLDSSGRERFVIAGLPNTKGHQPPTTLRQFLSDLGRTHLDHPQRDTWTVAQALQPLSWLVGTTLTGPA